MSDKHSDSYSEQDDSNKDFSKDFSEDLDKDFSKDQTKPLPPKGKRGRKIKYLTEEERIEARRSQQKAYRERKKTEVEELKARIAAVEDFIKDLVKERSKELVKECSKE